MKTISVTKYVCDICGHEYLNIEDAQQCEARPVTHDKGVKVGDTVLITGGEGMGEEAIVKKVRIYSGYHYPHTVVIDADLIHSWGTRTLVFNQYEKVN